MIVASKNVRILFEPRRLRKSFGQTNASGGGYRIPLIDLRYRETRIVAIAPPNRRDLG
jgi:hypothetical protein